MSIHALLRAHDLRVTQAREAVWNVLEASEGHLTASEIAARVAEADASINVSSVYRTLTTFADVGLVRESHLGDGVAAHWEITHDDTVIHVVCTTCGTVHHHQAGPVDDLRAHLLRAAFDLDEIAVRATARSCPACPTGPTT